MTIAFLLARQRSGTGALGSVLDQHPEIRYVGEVFHPAEAESRYSYFRFLTELVANDPRRALPGSADANFADYLQRIRELSDKSVTVLDVKYNSLHHFNRAWHGLNQRPRLLDLVKDGDFPVIHLMRRNFVKTFVSGRLAEMNSVWHAKGTDALPCRTLQVDCAQLARYLESTRSEVDTVYGSLQHDPWTIHLYYEELLEPTGEIRASTLAELSASLGVAEFSQRRPAFIKQTHDDLSQVIENHEEVRHHLMGTQFDWMV